MDPEACFDRLIRYLNDDGVSSNDAHESFDNLETWMRNGGFRPVALATDETLMNKFRMGYSMFAHHVLVTGYTL